MAAYYNEIDPFAAAWLRELIKRGLIADGVVDERSIVDVAPEDVREFTQCHFFAGIGGWSYALRLAGWPDDRPIWTGSCPCQPFSTAGRRKGTSDERHLWPAFFWLISQCKPHTVMGEQVASKDALAWCDLVRTDLEGAGYAFGVQDTCAAGFGAPHIRQRLYWVGDNTWARLEGQPESDRSQKRRQEQVGCSINSGDVVCGKSGGTPSTNGFWRNPDWLWCRDKKWRPVKSGLSPLADGLPEGVVRGRDFRAISQRLKGYGNAIVAPQAAEIIKAFMEVCDD